LSQGTKFPLCHILAVGVMGIDNSSLRLKFRLYLRNHELAVVS
jgi:hypothetical protein